MMKLQEAHVNCGRGGLAGPLAGGPSWYPIEKRQGTYQKGTGSAPGPRSTPWRSALRKDDFMRIGQIFDEGVVPVDHEDPSTGLTPLIAAAREDTKMETAKSVSMMQMRLSWPWHFC